MNNIRKYLILPLCLVAFTAPLSASQQSMLRSADTTSSQMQDENVKEIKQVIKNYAKSVSDLDLNLAQRIWQTTPQTTFIHPRGNEIGWESIKNNFYKKVMGETFSKRQLNIHDDMNIQLYGDTAVAIFEWDFPAIFRADNSPITTRGRETQVYHKTPTGWKIVHVHYSNMPVTGERKGF